MPWLPGLFHRIVRPAPARAKRPSNSLVLSLEPIRQHFEKEWQVLGPQLDQLTERIVELEMAGRGRYARFRNVFLLQFTGRSESDTLLQAHAVASKLLELMFAGKNGIGVKPAELIMHDIPPMEDGHAARRASRGVRPIFMRLFRSLRRKRQDWPRVDWIEGDAPDDAQADSLSRGSKPEPARTKSDRAASPGAPKHQRETAAAAGGGSRTRTANPRTPPNSAVTGGGASRAGTPPPNARSAEDLARMAREARQIEANMASALEKRSESVVTDRREFIFPPYDLAFVFRPAWNRERNVLATYFCLPVCKRNGSLREGDEVLSRKGNVADVLTLDLLTVQAVNEQAGRLLEQGIPAIIAVPVHLTTLLDSNSRLDYTEALDKISEGARRQLVFELVNAGEVAGESRAFDVLRRLTPYCRGVLGRVPLHESNFAFWKQAGFAAVGAHLADDGRPEARIFEDLDAFAGYARSHKIASYVRGLRSTSLTAAAAGAGFVHIETAARDLSPGETGFGVAPFTLSDLYGGLTGTDG